MAQKRKKINGKYEFLPNGVTLETLRGEKRLVHCFQENGKRKREYYPATDEGLRDAKKAAEQKEREKKELGARFGSISIDEKQAIELWRAYRDECMREACTFLPMHEIVREALAMFRQKSISPMFEAVAKEYERAEEGKNVSAKHLEVINQRVRIICRGLGSVRVCHVTAAMVEDFLNGLRGRNGGGCAPATRRGYMVLLGAIFKHAMRRGYVNDNPVEAMQKPIVKTSEPDVLSVEDCRVILRWVAKNFMRYLPGVVINMFCGVRPAELARLRYSDLFPGGRTEIYLSRNITKTNVDRRSQLRNVAAWLEYAKAQGVIMEPGAYVLPADTERRRVDNYAALISKRIKEGCGLMYKKDALRHTAVSMLCAKIGRAAAADELGHDTHTQAKHYRVAITETEANAFFEMTPASLGL